MRYVVKNNSSHCVVESKNNKKPIHILELMQRAEPLMAWSSCEEVPKGKRICEKCGAITTSLNKNHLCKKCGGKE